MGAAAASFLSGDFGIDAVVAVCGAMGAVTDCLWDGVSEDD